MHKRSKRFYTLIHFISLATLGVLCAPTTLNAAVTVDQAFTWGTIGMTDNSIVSSLAIQTNGTTIATGSIVEIITGQPGIFTIDGLPVDTAIVSVDVAVTSAMQFGGSETFNIDNFNVAAPASTTGDEAQITIGARLVTTGSGTGYIDGSYTASLEVTFNF